MQRYSKTFALTQFRAKMPEVVREAGLRATRDLKAEVLRALRCRPLPRGSLPKALEDAVRKAAAKDVAAELLKIKAPRTRRPRTAKASDDDNTDEGGGLFSDETFGEDTGWWTE